MTTDERLTDEEYMRRLRARFIERAGEGADVVVEGCSVAEWREMNDVPEDAADDEMEYWADDGDE